MIASLLEVRIKDIFGKTETVSVETSAGTFFVTTSPNSQGAFYFREFENYEEAIKDFNDIVQSSVKMFKH